MYGSIPLTDETGKEYEFEILEMLYLEDHVYYVLFCEEVSADEVTILEAVDIDDETEEYLPVEDEDLLNKLFAMFLERRK